MEIATGGPAIVFPTWFAQQCEKVGTKQSVAAQWRVPARVVDDMTVVVMTAAAPSRMPLGAVRVSRAELTWQARER
ncbi:hypothetical protein HNP02_006747 [Mycobacterium sp. AZCC_0083]|nr:hypothetical protein [Mycobacterium sp. AZCC_0083]